MKYEESERGCSKARAENAGGRERNHLRGREGAMLLSMGLISQWVTHTR